MPSFNVNCLQNIYLSDKAHYKCQLIFSLLLFLLNGCCGSAVMTTGTTLLNCLRLTHILPLPILDPAAASCFMNKQLLSLKLYIILMVLIQYLKLDTYFLLKLSWSFIKLFCEIKNFIEFPEYHNVNPSTVKKAHVILSFR